MLTLPRADDLLEFLEFVPLDGFVNKAELLAQHFADWLAIDQQVEGVAKVQRNFVVRRGEFDLAFGPRQYRRKLRESGKG